MHPKKQPEMKEVVMPGKRKKINQRQALVANPKYGGKYVAFNRDRKDRKIVASSCSFSLAFKTAQKRGVSNPLIVTVPKPNMMCAY